MAEMVPRKLAVLEIELDAEARYTRATECGLANAIIEAAVQTRERCGRIEWRQCASA